MVEVVCLVLLFGVVTQCKLLCNQLSLSFGKKKYKRVFM